MPKLIARRGNHQFAFAVDGDETKAMVFDAPLDTLFPPVDAKDLLARGMWEQIQAPGSEVYDSRSDDALEAAQARVAVLWSGPTNQNAAEKGDPTGLTDGQPAWTGTEEELTLAADDVVTAAGDEGDGGDEGSDEEPVPDEEFTVTLLEEGVPTIDGRIFSPESVTWREPPIPLMFTTENTGEGHKGSRLGGVITRVFRDGAKIRGAGRFDMSDDGQELKRLIADGVLNGVSSDVGGALAEMGADENGVVQQQISQGRIMGCTVLPFPAFDDTRISVVAALQAEIRQDDVAVPPDQIQEPVKQDDDSLKDAQQAAQLGDIADALSDIAQRVEEQAEQELDEDEEDEVELAARIEALELAVQALGERILARAEYARTPGVKSPAAPGAVRDKETEAEDLGVKYELDDDNEDHAKAAAKGGAAMAAEGAVELKGKPFGGKQAPPFVKGGKQSPEDGEDGAKDDDKEE